MSVSRVQSPSHHILLDGDLGLLLYQDPGKPASSTGQSSATEGTEPQKSMIFEDFSGGMGHSRRTSEAPNTYDYATNPSTGGGVCTRYQGLAIPAGELTELSTASWGVASGDIVVDAVEFRNGLWLVTTGRKLIEYGAWANGVAVNTYDGGVGWQGLSCAIFEGSLWVGTDNNSATNGLLKVDSSGTFTVNATLHRGHLRVVYWVIRGVGGYRLVGTNSGASEVRHCTTTPGTASEWTGPIGIDSVGTIHKLVASNRHVYAVMDDGVRDIDARGYTPNLTPYWLDNLSTLSGRAALLHDGHLLVSHYEGVDSIDVSSGARQDIPTWIDPVHTLPFEGPVRGSCTALATERGWVVAALFDGTDSFIIYGASRERLGIQGRGPYVWHGAEAVFRGQKVTWMRVVSLTQSGESNPRLFVATQDQTTLLPRLFQQSLPQFGTPYSDYRAGGTMRFTSTGPVLVLGADAAGDPAARKILTEHAIGSEGLGTPGNALALSTAMDGGAAVAQGTARTSPSSEFRAPLTAGYQVAHRIDFSGQAASPPILRSLRSRCELVVDQTVHRHYRVLIGRSNQQLGSGRPSGDARRDFRRLLALQDADPVTMVDELGDRLVVKVQSNSVKWTAVRDETGGGWSRVVEFDITEIRRPAYYNSGFLYNDGERYG